ncbi:MAG: AAA family ATPase [Alloprevotella sp.]|nr:AAA family ATPase [Alloprevotella sp.]
MKMNEELARARRIVENTGSNLFLTGKAGTGKTTFLRQLANTSLKRLVVLAPTGIAAINAGGVTIHSFFQFPFSPFLPGAQYKGEMFRLNRNKIRLIRNLDLIVIDEISMVRADLLDRIDTTLRRYRNPHRPFGGVQLLLIGDLQQLAPVAKEEEWALLGKYYTTPYFFSSHALQDAGYLTLELHHVFRQQDERFLHLLNKIREGNTTEEILSALNQRYIPNFSAPANAGYIRLMTHNAQARATNTRELAALPTPEHTFKAEIKGDFPPTSFPTDEELHLKVGAQVMFVKNDSQHRYFNGSLGEVCALSDTALHVRLHAGGEEVEVERERWENTRYTLNTTSMEVEEDVEGVFRQYPLKLAWAITIHKSQGLTFDRAIIDAHAAFSHGQTYVALSRCRTLEGLVLSTPIPASAVITDAEVYSFSEKLVASTPDDMQIAQREKAFYLSLVEELFTFREEAAAFDHILRLMEEFFYRQFPSMLQAMQNHRARFRGQAEDVAVRFHAQYAPLIAQAAQPEADDFLQQRIRSGADYFGKELEALRLLVRENRPASGNKQVEERVKRAYESITELLKKHIALLRFAARHGVEPRAYQRARSLAVAGESLNRKKKKVPDDLPF